MKIAIDISQIIYGTGVSTYTKQLVENLLKVDTKNEYILFGGSLRRRSELLTYMNGVKAKNVSNKINRMSPALADLLFNRFRHINIEKYVGNIDVLHSSDWSQPKSRSFTVTTVHDLVPFLYPELSSRKLIHIHKRRLEIVRDEVDRIIVPSITTKNDLITMGFAESKIRVIAESYSPWLKKVSIKQIKRIKTKYKIDGDYLLVVGITPRKNINRIIQAFDYVRPGQNLKLVMTGTPNNLEIEERRDVRLVGHVSDSELSILYAGAKVFLYPSLYEGFGIPILDAMKAKTPVVTSNYGSMKEIAADAAILVNPEDVYSIVGGIKEAILKEKLLVEKGIQRVKEFSWKKMAEETLDVYNEANS